MTIVRIDLNDELAEQARGAGLFEAEAMDSMLRRQLRIMASQAWESIRAEQETDPIPAMTAEEIQAEIDAVRVEMRLAAHS